MKKQQLLNTWINNLDMEETIACIQERIREGIPSYVVEVNVDVVVKMERDAGLRKIAKEADLTLVDGKPLIWISKLYGRPVKMKISGSDLVPELIKTAVREGYSVFILGGMGNTARKAASRMKAQFPTLKIAGAYGPPMGFEQDQRELERINQRILQSRPDILLACFGCPKQERWVYENYRKAGATVTVCAGATVDFLAGTIKRSPKWVSHMGFEWLWRFLKEPKRLFKRYFVDDTKILLLIWKYRKQRQRDTGKEAEE